MAKSAVALQNFYRHQKSPQRTSLDKIETQVEKENQKKDNSALLVVAVETIIF